MLLIQVDTGTSCNTSSSCCLGQSWRWLCAHSRTTITCCCCCLLLCAALPKDPPRLSMEGGFAPVVFP